MPSGEVVDPPYSLKPAEENELDQVLLYFIRLASSH